MATAAGLSRVEWGYLYLHANGLAELSLEQLAVELDAPGEPAAPTEPMDAAQREAAALALFANMNVETHMAGLPWDSAEHEQRVLREAAQLAAMPQPEPQLASQPVAQSVAQLASQPAFQPLAETGAQPGDWQGRVTGWLQQAYAAHPTLALDMARFDQDKVARLLAALPPGLASLIGPLDAAAFDQWLNLWQAGEPALLDLVGEVLV